MTTSLQEIRETKLREEFLKAEIVNDFEYTGRLEQIADWWLAKCDSLIKERDAELVAQMEIKKKEHSFKVYLVEDIEKESYNQGVSDCQLLLTTTPTEGGE